MKAFTATAFTAAVVLTGCSTTQPESQRRRPLPQTPMAAPAPARSPGTESFFRDTISAPSTTASPASEPTPSASSAGLTHLPGRRVNGDVQASSPRLVAEAHLLDDRLVQVHTCRRTTDRPAGSDGGRQRDAVARRGSEDGVRRPRRPHHTAGPGRINQPRTRTVKSPLTPRTAPRAPEWDWSACISPQIEHRL